MNARRPRRNPRYDDGGAPDTVIDERNDFKINSFHPVIDQFLVSLQKIITVYEESHSRFAFLKKLDTLTVEEITNNANNLCEIYTDDVDDNLRDEIIQFRLIFIRFIDEKDEDMSPELFML